MTLPAAFPTKLPALLGRTRFYYGWVVVALAAVAMVGTLPGRTQGLGLITESLLQDLRLSRVEFAHMNLWATLLGSLCCIGIGRLQDRLGSRIILATVAALLGAVVLLMSVTTGTMMMFALLVLSRGLGQSALSVVSLAMVGQWFRRRLPAAMAFYSITLSIGFMAAFPIVGEIVKREGWRTAWAAIGWCLLPGLALLGWWLARRSPEECGLAQEGAAATADDLTNAGATLGQALRTPAFWVFAVASSTYNLVASGVGLFNESILAERGFPADIYHRSLVFVALFSLVGNFLGGWLASRWSMSRLMALAMALLSLALLSLPSLTTLAHVDAFSVVMGLAGGFVIVIFFSFWAKAFGRAHLGRITGTAQMMTVLASALGPILLARCHSLTGSYAAVFYALAAVVAALGVAAWIVRVPASAQP
ncbi:MAG: MFS transporter [Opitutaceae bacterium]|nr:MFS transporter [Opitutaceae bacterium]